MQTTSFGKPFLDDKGRFRTASLFLEFDENSPTMTPVFTLSEDEHSDCYSMRKLYMECNDPTEHIFATTIIGSWEGWKRLLKCRWFESHIVAWREELKAKLDSEAISNIRLMAMQDTPAGLNAAKWLVQHKFNCPEVTIKKSNAGRPKKVKEDKVTSLDEVRSDFKRLKLK